MAAAGCAKLYALTPTWPSLLGALALYTLGNLMVIRVVREVGLGPALSLSAILQLIVVNLMAVVVFRERLTAGQYLGLALGVVAVALITLPAGAAGADLGPTPPFERRHLPKPASIGCGHRWDAAADLQSTLDGTLTWISRTRSGRVHAY